MHKFLKTVHLLGLGTGFGGLLCRIFTAAHVGPLILGGLAISALSGVLMMRRLKLFPPRQPWLLIHLSAATAGTLAAAVITTPAGHGMSSTFTDPLGVLGALLLILTVVFGVFKPRLIRRANTG